MARKEDMATLFGRKLKRLLKEKDVSQNRLANEIEIDRASIGKYLRGETSPRLDTFLAICNYLEVQPNYFLNPNYNDYSIDSSKTEERKIIESLYILCKHGIISRIPGEPNYYNNTGFVYGINVASDHLLIEILEECLKIADSRFAKGSNVCKKIADEYEPELIELKVFDED